MNCTGLKELLENFIEKKCVECDYPPELDELLSDTARTGVVRFSWKLLKPLLKYRLERIFKSDMLVKYPEEDEELPSQLLQRLDTFDNPPFTIQRVCELVTNPKQYYKRRDKYLRAMEKNLMVVSTHEPDLTWMKSPRLTQLLEEPTTEPLNRLNHTPSHIHSFNEPTTDMAEEPTQSHTARFTPPRIDPAPKSCSDGAQELEGPHLSSLHLQRKRNSSLRDSLEQNGGGGGGVGEGEVMGLVLQEADSTTIEHLSHPIQPSSSSLEQVSVLASSYRNSDPGVGGGANKQGGSGQSLEVKEESPQRVSQEKMEEEEGATVTPKKILCAETIGGGVSGMEGVASKVDTLGGRASGLEGRASGMETIEGGASGLETLGGGAGIEKGGGALGLGNDGSAQKMEACKEEATGQMEVTQERTTEMEGHPTVMEEHATEMEEGDTTEMEGHTTEMEEHTTEMEGTHRSGD